MSIDKKYYEERSSSKFPDKDFKAISCKQIVDDVDEVMSEISRIIKEKSIFDVSTWILDKINWLDYEKNGSKIYPHLGKWRVVNVNPGIDNVGREQRNIHMYIVLAEYKETFVGIPITNAAILNNVTVLRNEMEVLLVNPKGKKPFKEFWIVKPSVADLRNIRGFDKSCVIDDSLYQIGRIVPDTYQDAISKGIIDTFTL